MEGGASWLARAWAGARPGIRLLALPGGGAVCAGCLVSLS